MSNNLPLKPTAFLDSKGNVSPAWYSYLAGLSEVPLLYLILTYLREKVRWRLTTHVIRILLLILPN